MENSLRKRKESFDIQYYGNFQEEDNTIDLLSLLRLFWKCKWSIVFITLIFLVSVTVWSLSIPPAYRATGTIHIQRGVDKITNHKINGQEEKIPDRKFYQSQYDELKKKQFVKKVLNKLKNKTNQVAVKQEKDKTNEVAVKQEKSIIKAWMEEAQKIVETNTGVKLPFPKDKKKYGVVSEETQFLDGLTIIPQEDSYEVIIQYDYSDPVVATERVNAIIDEFVKSYNEVRKKKISDFNDEKAIKKKELEDIEQKLAAYDKRYSLTKIDGTEKEIGEKRLFDLASAVTRAENARIAAESRYHNRSFGVIRATINPKLDNAIIATLRKEIGNLEIEYKNKLKIKKPAFPDMVTLKTKILQLKSDLKKEEQRFTKAVNKAEKEGISISNASLKNAVQAAREEELTLKEAFRKQKIKLSELEKKKKMELFELKKDEIKYNSLKIEVSEKRNFYKTLFKRDLEVDFAVRQGGENLVKAGNHAEIPYKPFKPNIKFNIFIGTMIGLFLGIVFVFLRHLLNDTVKSSAEIKKTSGLPILGTIPKMKARKVNIQALQTFNYPQSTVAEAYRSLGIMLSFSTFGDPKILLLVSPSPNEGTTTTAINLASAFAKAGKKENKKVLLIDADLRKPALHKRLKLDNSIGFSNCLLGESNIQEAVQEKVLGELSILTVGTKLDNPIELFSGNNIITLLQELSKIFDHIILDAPSVIGLADSLILANVASMTLMIASHEQTRMKTLMIACDKIRQSQRGQEKLVGCIYTKVETRDSF